MAHYLIVGAGRSALGACKLLLRDGHSVTVSDIEEKFPAVLNKIRGSGARVLIGAQSPALLEEVHALVVSPGLSPKIPLLEAARHRNIPIVSEIDVALERYDGLVIGVTGTNGKSTTTLLLAHFLKATGLDAEASGNIGIAPSLILASGHKPDALVLELSSYQLDYSKKIPNRISLFMSFAPDHMERHGTLEAYFLAKWKLIEASDGLIILPKKILEFALQFKVNAPRAPIAQILIDDEPAVNYRNSRIVRIDSKRGMVESCLLDAPEAFPMPLEIHNQLNAAAALIAANFIRPRRDIFKSLLHFEWLPYRFQKIGTINDQPVFNDSKSTNVESTDIALTSLSKPCVLLLGGAPKGESYAPLLGQASKILQLISFGAAAPQINDELRKLMPLTFPTLREALLALPSLISRLAEPAPIVFSPANASFDEFNNFEERGLFFNTSIAALLDPQKS